MGLVSNRDSWVYNFSQKDLKENMKSSIEYYNGQVNKYAKARQKQPEIKVEDVVDKDPTKISWSSSLDPRVSNDIFADFMEDGIVTALYRPFTKHSLYTGDWKMIHRRGQWPQLFPTPEQKNFLICVSGISGTKDMSVLMSNCITDLHFNGDCQCIPLYYYDEPVLDGVKAKQANLFDTSEKTQYRRHDGVTDFILKRAQENYGKKVTKEDIFYYVYGLLHSPVYRKKFAADLKKVLPRIPLVEDPKNFRAFSKAGRELAELHSNYESVETWPVKEFAKKDDYIVEKMRFAKKNGKDDKTVINYNSSVTISGIPLEAYDYIVNGKSAIEWIMERYAVTRNTDSNIKNDPNEWAKEQGNPRYIIDLLESVITVSIETMKIVNGLPDISEDLG
jgi:predicted helicase